MITEVINSFVLSNGHKAIKIQKSGYYVMSVTYTPIDTSPEFGVSDGVNAVDLFLTSSNTVHLYRVVLDYYEAGRSIDFNAMNCLVRIMIERVE